MQITYVSDATISRRLTTIYQYILRKDKQSAIFLLKDTVYMVENAVECDLSSETQNIVIDNLYRALIEMAMSRFDGAHNYIRDTFYHIESKYIPEYRSNIEVIMV